MEIRTDSDRHHVDHGWLKSAHSFSFGAYYNPQRMGFGVLRVINDDRVVPGSGFPPHPHHDMEIVSYVVEGALAHRDTLGNGSVIRPGEVQRMSAGSGIAHSELNPSHDEGVRFLQIWVKPAVRGTEPSYAQREFAIDPQTPLQLVVSPDGAQGSLTIGQDVRIHRMIFSQPRQQVVHALPARRSAWLQVVRGELRLHGQALREGDAGVLPEGGRLEIAGGAGAEGLLFDVPQVARE